MGPRLSRAPYFERWLVAGIIVGALIGVAAIVIYYMVYAISGVALRYLFGVSPLGFTEAQYRARLAYLLLMPAVLAASYPVSLLAALAAGTPEVGSDRAVRAYHHNERLRAGEAASAILSSAITIGMGGSAGLEGPMAHAGAAIAQAVSRLLGMSAEDRRRAVAIGLGAGIGTIFKSPFAGAVLSAELLYRSDIEPEVIYPSMVASAVGYAVFGAATGYAPVFGLYTGPFRPLYLPLFAVLGLVAGGVAMLYTRSLGAVASALRRAARNPVARAALGGAAAGAVAVLFPEVMGEGFGWVRMAEAGAYLPSVLPLAALVALLPLAKVLATSLTLGSGAKGGVFAPSLDIGAFTGLAAGLAFRALMPGLVRGVAPFVIVGMLATFGAASAAPISSMLMTVEMTGALSLLPGEMIALAIAMLVFRGPTLVRTQYRSRAESPAHAGEYMVPVLRSVSVSEVPPRPAYVRHDARVADALAALSSEGLLSLPVVDSVGRVLGVVNAAELRSGKPDEPVMKYLRPEPGHVRPDSSLEEALNMMARTHSSYVIVEEEGRFVGIVKMEELVAAYERALLATTKGRGRAEAG